MKKRRQLGRGVAIVGAGMSGLEPEDIQFSEVHDCFSIAELVHIEDLGFFKTG